MNAHLVRTLAFLAAIMLAVGGSACAPTNGDGVETAGRTSGPVGSRENPVPIGVEARVGQWQVAVTDVDVREPPFYGKNDVFVYTKERYVGEGSWPPPPSDGSPRPTVEVLPKPIRFSFLGSEGDTFNEATYQSGIQSAGFMIPSGQVRGGVLVLEDTTTPSDEKVYFAVE